MSDAALTGRVGSAGGSPIRRILLTREAGVFAALLLLCLVFAYMSPVFTSSRNLVNLLRQISLLGVMSIGATYVLIIAEVDLSVGSLYGFAGMVTGMLIVRAGSRRSSRRWGPCSWCAAPRS